MTRGTTLLACAAGAFLASGCINLDVGLETEPMVETVVHGETGPKVLLVAIEGVIEAKEDDGVLGMPRPSPVARLREQLGRAREDSEVRALLVRINSPGGTVTASEVVYREILRYKHETGVPVVAQLMGTATSGAYYAAMAADVVIAHPTTVTGSIGVLFLGINVAGLMEKVGIENQTLTAGARKDSGSPLRPMRPEERAHLQSVLDDLHLRFKEAVAAGRPELDRARVDALADGRIYSAAQALENGLVDALGDMETAIAESERRAGLASSRVVTYHRPREWRHNVYTQPPTRGPGALRLELWPGLADLPRPGFHYLWLPGSLQ